MKSIFVSKTFYVNLIAGVVSFLEGQQVLDLFSAATLPYIAAAVFGLNIVLRYVTTQAVSISVPSAPSEV